MPIQNISDTARWVAVYRAMESERSDAHFHDPFAARLAGAEGITIVNNLKRGRALAWSMIVRTAVFDDLIMDRVRHDSIDTVINLAAGLDTRAWRLPLPSTLRWFDVDLPGITEYKAVAMRGESPACKYEAIAADLTDSAARAALLERLAVDCSAALVITEGLLVYLGSEQVGALARDIHSMQCARWWLLDLASPMLLSIMNRHWGKSVATANAPFRFAPAEGTAFFDEFGWHERIFLSGLEEAHRLRREMRTAPFWRLLTRLSPPRKREEIRRMAGYVMLERND